MFWLFIICLCLILNASLECRPFFSDWYHDAAHFSCSFQSIKQFQSSLSYTHDWNCGRSFVTCNNSSIALCTLEEIVYDRNRVYKKATLNTNFYVQAKRHYSCMFQIWDSRKIAQEWNHFEIKLWMLNFYDEFKNDGHSTQTRF